jgi:hypothetical protein
MGWDSVFKGRGLCVAVAISVFNCLNVDLLLVNF